MENCKGSGRRREHTVQGAPMLTQEHGVPSNLSLLHETVLVSEQWLGPIQGLRGDVVAWPATLDI